MEKSPGALRPRRYSERLKKGTGAAFARAAFARATLTGALQRQHLQLLVALDAANDRVSSQIRACDAIGKAQHRSIDKRDASGWRHRWFPKQR